MDAIWQSLCDPNLKKKNIHLQCGIAVELILKSSLTRKSLDNVTCILVFFNNFENAFNSTTISSNFQENLVKINEEEQYTQERKKKFLKLNFNSFGGNER